MSDTGTENTIVAAVPAGVDDAVGVAEKRWYVAMVNARHEKKVADSLSERGVESYVATQREVHVWANGRRRAVDRVVIPAVVFVKCTEACRKEIVNLPYIFRFMVNRTVDPAGGNRPVATIPERQMQTLKFMLGQSEIPVDFTPAVFRLHDTVRVIRGHLKGLEGTIISNPDGSHTLAVSLDLLGGATVKIDPSDVERLTEIPVTDTVALSSNDR
ncbi:MAG: UpxY family transcription antiterminator [Duncaniella sp.]|nr:UpxY family transcription antiterminator [Duncaniella sp.]